MRIEDIFFLVKKILRYLLLPLIVISSISGLNAQRYTLTVQTDGTPGARVSPSGSTTIQAGQSRNIQVTRIPDGFLFSGWTASANADVEDNNSEKTTVTVNGNATVTANFTEEEEDEETYSLDVVVNGQGKVTVNPDRDEYTRGTRVTLTATPASGWVFDRWSGDASGSANPLQVTMDDDKDITANFTEEEEDEETYSLDVVVNGQGKVTVNPDRDEYTGGTRVTLTATPASGWVFDRWSGDASGSANPLQVTMDDDKDITANFTDAGGIENQPPVVNNVDISNVPDVCRELTASYEYSDPDNDPEGGTVIRWFRSDNASENNLLEIHQGSNYTLALEDDGKFISIEVTPAAASGASPGEPVRSDFYGPAIYNLPTVSITGPPEFCMGSSIDLVFELTGAAPWTVEYTDGQNDFSFTTSESSYELTVSSGGIFQVISVIDTHGCEGTETGGGHLVNAAATVTIADWYIETFQDASSQWVSAGDDVNSWTYGLPDGDIFTSASEGGNIWYTDILNPNGVENSRVVSPCFDFTNIKRPMIAIDLWREFSEQSDGAVLQYSLDNSGVWVNIGNPEQGINWYNSTQITGNPGGQPVGWTGTGNGNGNGSWSESRHDLDILADENQVRFRVAYGSDGSGRTQGGVAFDNIRIGERSRRVLIEHFTNARQEESIEANKILHGFALERKSDIAYISYHTPFPQSDPINEQNSADPAARALFYSVVSAPVSIMDGGLDGEGRFDYSSSVISEDELLRRALVDPEFKIEISQTQTNNNLNIEIQVSSLFNFGPRDLTLHVAILETEILASQLGLQGDQVYRNVVRKLQPDAGGTFLPVNWSAGETQSYSFDWTITGVFDTEKLAVVAFIQDEVSAEVYQVGTSYEFGIPTFVDLPDYVIEQQRVAYYPNPASDYVFIEFRDNIQGDHILEVFNVSGTMIKSEILKAGRSVYEIDISTLNRGVYIYRIKNNGGTEDTTRIMIMK